MRRILVLGIVGALLLGVLIATATATVEQTDAGVDATPMTIPSGKVGDVVTYATFIKSGQQEAVEYHGASASAAPDNGAESVAASSSVSGDWQPGGLSVISLEALGTSLDRDGRLHDVLVVRSNSSYDGYSGTSVDFVELVQRSVVRSDYKSDFASGSDVLAFASFYEPGDNIMFPHQGRTYTLGQELESPDVGDHCSFSSFGAGWGGSNGPLPHSSSISFDYSSQDCSDMDFGPEILSTKSWVAARGLVDGHDAYDLRTETVMRLQEMSMSISSDGTSESTKGDSYEIRSVLDEWVSDEIPYSLLTESVAYRGEDELGRGQMSLQEYRPGSAEIPWKASEDAAPWTPERGQGGPAPADGTGLKLAYPLGQALGDVGGPQGPLLFQAWRQTHPEAVLVAARLTNGENSQATRPSLQWSLFFAEPDGDAHGVATERASGVAAPIVSDRGDVTVDPFTAEDQHAGLVTLAEIERAWLRLTEEKYANQGVNYVAWGLDVTENAGLTCLGGSSSSKTGSPASVKFRQVYLGWASVGSCLESSPDIDANIVVYDADRARLLTLIEFHDSFDITPHADAPHRGDVEAQSAPGTLRIAKPDIAVATVTSSSLLAIFLVGYFLPALKVVGAQALLFVPGYAKLRKEAILDNKIRDQILEVVKQDPGVSISEVGKKVQAGWGTIVYHLDVLEKNKMVSMVLDGRHRRVFPVGLVDFSQQGQLALLKNERVRALYHLIQEEPGVIQDALAKRIGISAPATYWHLKRLEDSGLVGRVRSGRRVQYFANEAPKVHDPDGMEVV